MWKCTEWRIQNRNLKSESESLPITTPGAGGTNETDTPHKYQDSTMGCLVSVDVPTMHIVHVQYIQAVGAPQNHHAFVKPGLLDHGADAVGMSRRCTSFTARCTPSKDNCSRPAHFVRFGSRAAPAEMISSEFFNCVCVFYVLSATANSTPFRGRGSHRLLPFRGIAQRRSVLEACQSVE